MSGTGQGSGWTNAGAQVTFNYTLWQTRFPEFSNVTSALAAQYFNEATLILNNYGTGPVVDPNVQLTLLNLLTAHLAMLYSGPAGGSPQSTVGRLASASKGSVSTSFELAAGSPEAMAAFLTQTQYGTEAWATMTPYRRGGYFPGPRRLPRPGAAWGGGYFPWRGC